ncbi:hypothetical protein ACFLX7_04975 [Chloroflexota bacterium]
MKSKTVATVIILLLASLVSLMVVSCGSTSTLVPSETETPSESSNDSQVPSEETNTDAEDACRVEIKAIAMALNTVFYALDEMLVNPEIEDDGWLITTALAVSDILTLCDKAGEITPPESMMDVHIVYLEAILHYYDAIEVLLEGLDEGDTDLINQASAEMWIASEILDQVVELPE